MKTANLDHDERTIAIENTSYRLAYLFLSFALLAIVAFRSFALRQSSWDLLAILVLSGIIAAVLRARQHAFTHSAGKSATFAIVGGLVVALLLGYGAKTMGAVSAGYRAAHAAGDSTR